VSPEEEPGSDALSWAGAVYMLNGVRLLVLDGQAVIGLWSDLDGPHIRRAMEIFHNQDIPVRYLDGPGIPARYKARTMKGTPVPLEILEAMMRADAEPPWVVRDRLLRAINWHCKIHVYGA